MTYDITGSVPICKELHKLITLKNNGIKLANEEFIKDIMNTEFNRRCIEHMRKCDDEYCSNVRIWMLCVP